MDTSSLAVVFALGIVGGILPEALRFYKLRESPDLPAYLKGPQYWIITIVMILIGGILAVVYQLSGMTVNPIIAVNLGASAPLAISALCSTTVTPPNQVRGKVKGPKTGAQGDGPTILKFLSGY